MLPLAPGSFGIGAMVQPAPGGRAPARPLSIMMPRVAGMIGESPGPSHGRPGIGFFFGKHNLSIKKHP
jgi:hypothetical protein